MADEKRHYNPLMVQHPLGADYDSIEFTLASGISDYNVGANQANAFANLKYYTTVNIRSDKELTAKFNSASNHSSTINRNRAYELDNLIKISNIFLSNASGSTAVIKIIGVQKVS